MVFEKHNEVGGVFIRYFRPRLAEKKKKPSPWGFSRTTTVHDVVIFDWLLRSEILLGFKINPTFFIWNPLTGVLRESPQGGGGFYSLF